MTLSTETSPTAGKRRRGRPRKDDADRKARRAEIINAATKLFKDQGYRETTMSDIARSLGMSQSSLYYWFKDKEELLGVILSDNSASSLLATELSKAKGDYQLHLYASVYADTMMMCSFPFDYYELESAALSYPERFKFFFDTYRNLMQAIAQIIQDGMKEGAFPDNMDAELAASIVLSLAEGLQHQYHQSMSTTGDALVGVWGGVVLHSAEELARVAADSAINAIASGIDTEELFESAVERGWIEAPH